MPVVEQQNGAADDHQREGDEGPRVEMQAEDRVAVARAARDDVDQHLPQRDGGADRSAEDRDAILARPRTEHEIERKPAARGKERSPLQDA